MQIRISFNVVTLRCIALQYGALHYACVPLAATKRAITKLGYLSAISARRKTQCHIASHMKYITGFSQLLQSQTVRSPGFLDSKNC